MPADAAPRTIPPAASAGRIAGSLAFALTLAVEAPGAAEPASEADRVATAQGLYEAAGALMQAGKLAEACLKLEESQRLDPAMGTEFFLATCYEHTDRPTSAWLHFLQVAAAAKAAGNVQRERTARARAAALEPKLPRLAVVVPDAVGRLPGVIVARDGAELKPVVWGAGVPVDLGEHTVRATASGKASWEATVVLRELGERREVTVPPLEDAHAPAVQAGGAAGPPPFGAGGMPGQRIAALVMGGAGVAGLVAGGSLGLVARGAWDHAVSACPAQQACSMEAHDASLRAVSLGTGSTAAFVAGGAALAGALVLWLTAPGSAAKTGVAPAPLAGPRAAGLSITGSF
jgi:hypothetical protein